MSEATTAAATRELQRPKTLVLAIAILASNAVFGAYPAVNAIATGSLLGPVLVGLSLISLLLAWGLWRLSRVAWILALVFSSLRTLIQFPPLLMLLLAGADVLAEKAGLGLLAMIWLFGGSWILVIVLLLLPSSRVAFVGRKDQA